MVSSLVNAQVYCTFFGNIYSLVWGRLEGAHLKLLSSFSTGHSNRCTSCFHGSSYSNSLWISATHDFPFELHSLYSIICMSTIHRVLRSYWQQDFYVLDQWRMKKAWNNICLGVQQDGRGRSLYHKGAHACMHDCE